MESHRRMSMIETNCFYNKPIGNCVFCAVIFNTKRCRFVPRRRIGGLLQGGWDGWVQPPAMPLCVRSAGETGQARGRWRRLGSCDGPQEGGGDARTAQGRFPLPGVATVSVPLVLPAWHGFAWVAGATNNKALGRGLCYVWAGRRGAPGRINRLCANACRGSSCCGLQHRAPG